MARFNIQVPITGWIEGVYEAESEEEAKQIALESVSSLTLTDLDDWQIDDLRGVWVETQEEE